MSRFSPSRDVSKAERRSSIAQSTTTHTASDSGLVSFLERPRLRDCERRAAGGIEDKIERKVH